MCPCLLRPCADANDAVAAAMVLLDAGVPSRTESGWTALSQLSHARTISDCLVHQLAIRNPVTAREMAVGSLPLAHALLDSSVIGDLDAFARQIQWHHFRLDDEAAVAGAACLLDRGVPPPRLTQIDGDYHRQWLEVGIPVHDEDVRSVLSHMQAEEDGDWFDDVDWTGLEDSKLLIASQAKASARALALSMPTEKPAPPPRLRL